MANREHLAKLKEGVEAWNEWRKQHPEIIPDLSGADLFKAELVEVQLFQANLHRTNLRGANLYRALLGKTDLGEATLRGADLGMAYLWAANLRKADLEYAQLANARLIAADLRGAVLDRTDLRSADFSGADLSEASIGFTTFGNNDLSETKGLVAVRHNGPSTIGIDTIYRSQGKIPLKFLRGAGVPDNFIEYMGSLTGKALEYYSCFISYSTKDQEFADRLYADLQDNGVRCWFAPHDIQPERRSMNRSTTRYEDMSVCS